MGVIVGGNSPTLYLDESELEQLKEALLNPVDIDSPENTYSPDVIEILRALEAAFDVIVMGVQQVSNSPADIVGGLKRNLHQFDDEIEAALEAVFAKKPIPRPPHLLCPFWTTLRFARRRLLRLIYGQGVDVGGNL